MTNKIVIKTIVGQLELSIVICELVADQSFLKAERLKQTTDLQDTAEKTQYFVIPEFKSVTFLSFELLSLFSI